MLSPPALACGYAPPTLVHWRTFGSATTGFHDRCARSFQPSVMHCRERAATAWMSSPELASRASDYRAVRAERDPRTTTWSFAAFTKTGSATTACIPEALLLPAPQQDAERLS